MQIWCTEVDISKKKLCAQFAVWTSDKLPVGLITSCQCKYLHILHKLLITKDTSIYYISCFSHRKVGGKKNDQHIRALFKTTENIYIQSACIMKKITSCCWTSHKLHTSFPLNCLQVYYRISEHIWASIKNKMGASIYRVYASCEKYTHLSSPSPLRS